MRRHAELVMGFGYEFMNRADGWPGLRRQYQLPQRGLTDDLQYFPLYIAVFLYRQELEQSALEFIFQLKRLSGNIGEAAMITPLASHRRTADSGGTVFIQSVAHCT